MCRILRKRHAGQIYMPHVKFLLFIDVSVLFVSFDSSSSLSAAYGIAVTGQMLITAILLFAVMRRLWKWSLPPALLIIVPLETIDLSSTTSASGWLSPVPPSPTSPCTTEYPSSSCARTPAGMELRHHVHNAFLSRRTILPFRRGGLTFWQNMLFISLAQNASSAPEYFQLPTVHVVELGPQVTM